VHFAAKQRKNARRAFFSLVLYVGALPQSPFKELFREKASLKILKKLHPEQSEHF
jgi:hypothetical protein